MNITLTLFMQLITFFCFVVLMMRLVWPKISQALETRRQKIADGLADAERSKRELTATQHKIKELIQEAKLQAATIIENANQRANQLEEQSREEGRKIVAQMKETAQADIKQAENKAKANLKDMVADMVIASTEKLLHDSASKINDKKLIDRYVSEL